MRVKLTTQNIPEVIARLQTGREEIPVEMRVGVVAALEIFHQETADYPPQPSYMGMRGYGLHVKSYRRTGTYGRQQFIDVRQVGPVVQGSLIMPTPYAIWLRGDLAGYLGAWMHRTIWKPLVSIVQDNLPKAMAVVQARIESVVKRMNS